jgi:hypothetical protein
VILYFRHLPTGRLVVIETRRGLAHVLASPWWEEARD